MDGVVTWTPGDVTVAEKKGGLVSIVSTKEIPLADAERHHRQQEVDGGQPRPREGDAGRDLRGRRPDQEGSGARSSRPPSCPRVVYGENDADYWQKYFKPSVQKDKQGMSVELGGSTVNGLAENVQLFGLDGKTNYFAATYTTFAEIVKSQYPKLLPAYDPVSDVVDASYLQDLAAKPATK